MLRPTFLAFETAKRSLQVSQAGLDIVGHNIANVKTPGYTRQRVDQVSLSSGGYALKYQIFGGGSQFAGQGAMMNGISQIRDPYLDTRYRNEAAAFGELATKSTGLTDLQNMLDEISTDGLHAELGKFIGQIRELGRSPDSKELAVVVRNMASSIAQMLNKSSSDLQGVLDQQKFDLNVAITDSVNSTIKQIAFLNTKIREDHIYGNPSNELMDERNLLIDQLSEFLPIKVIRTPEKISDDRIIERVSIQMVDNSASPPASFDLISNGTFNQLKVNEQPDQTISISLLEGASGFPLRDDITGNITKGAIKGYLDIINGKGDFAAYGENTYRGVPYYQQAMDTFAARFAELMNQTNSISVQEAAGKSQVYEYNNKNLFTALGGGQITAANIQISSDWLNDPHFLTTSKMDPSLPEQDKDKDGNLLFDNAGNPVMVVRGNSDNVNKFLELLEGPHSFPIVNGSGDTITLFTGSFQEYLVSKQSDVGLDKKLNDTLLTASETLIGGFTDQRDAISAVSVDEEAINMMTYQNYYNAAARYMTTLDEALGTIIERMGVVGR